MSLCNRANGSQSILLPSSLSILRTSSGPNRALALLGRAHDRATAKGLSAFMRKDEPASAMAPIDGESPEQRRRYDGVARQALRQRCRKVGQSDRCSGKCRERERREITLYEDETGGDASANVLTGLGAEISV